MKKPLGIKVLLTVGIIIFIISIISSLLFLVGGSLLLGFFSVLVMTTGGQVDGGSFETLFKMVVLMDVPSCIFLFALIKRKYVLTLIMLSLFVLVSGSGLFKIISIVMLVVALADNESKMYLKGYI